MSTTQQNRPVFMYILGIVIIVGVALAALFNGIDRLALGSYTVDAVIENKEYVPPGMTTSTQMIAGTARSVPVAKDEQYILYINDQGTTVRACVNKQRYNGFSVGDNVNITCRKRRITGKVDILSVN
ncbi:MAG: hypothetical protein JW863_09505 [Chitinispirillaceae bacterium]|nr:hypothetical protein [Chitinispirillaceae bacterium]